MPRLRDILERNPVIPAIRNADFLEEACESASELGFVVMSNLVNLRNIVSTLKAHNKLVFIHIDMVAGLSSDNYTVDYLMREVSPDGLITTKHNVALYARKQKIPVIQRFFIIDSFSFENSVQHIRENKPDAVEVLPGIIPGIISRMSVLVPTPIIASGLIGDKSDVTAAIRAGAVSVSTSKKSLWNI
ncbi:MAG: glycerol-3-phosphate responsive antiterminator [Fusobacteriaceae bacterium]|nr:glycerol-3-phosphate responsive antiterminator [Fusobacteriaceae bacterium]